MKALDLKFPIHRIVREMSETERGVLDEGVVILRLAKFLEDNPQYQTEPYQQAKAAFSKYKKLLRPNAPSVGQVYHPERIMPAKGSQRTGIIMMKLAGPVQLEFWGTKDHDAANNMLKALRTKDEYRETRIDAFKTTGLTTLDEIETRVFGYSHTSDLPPEVMDRERDEEE